MRHILSKRQTYYIVSAAFLIISFVTVFLWKNQTYIGVTIHNLNGQWTATYCDPNGEAYHSGIRTGDIIIRINHEPVEKYPNIIKWNEAEGASAIEYRQAGQSEIRILDIHPKNTLMNVLTQFPYMMLAAIFGIIGFIACLKRPFMIQARALFWLNLCIGLAIINIPASAGIILFAKEAEFILVSLSSYLLVNFFSMIPAKNKSTWVRYIKILFLISFVTLSFLALLQSFGIIHMILILRKFCLISVSMAFVFAIATQVRFVCFQDSQIRNQAIIFLGGTLLAFLPFFFLKVIPTVFNIILSINFSLFYLFLALAPVTWYYVIFTKVLPDYHILFSKAGAFLIMALISGGVLFLAAIYLDLLKTSDLNAFLQIVSLAIWVIIWSSFIYITIDRLLAKFIKKKADPNFTDKLSQITANLALFDEVFPYGKVIKDLNADSIFLIACDQRVEYIKKTFGHFPEDVTTQDKLMSYFETKPVCGGNKGDQGDQEIVMLPEDIPATFYIPHTVDNFVCGIFITYKDPNMIPVQRELMAIAIAAKEIARIYLIAYTINKLSQDIEEIERKSELGMRHQRFLIGSSSAFKNLEKDRKMIAEEIHAGPLQLGLDLSRWLKVLADQPSVTKDKMTAKVITHLEEVIAELNVELHQTCNQLRPSTLNQLGLLSAVELLCKDIIFKESLLTSLNFEGFDRDSRFSEEVEIAAYRFIQEGITNVLKHAGVNRLQINLFHTKSQLTISIEDAGKGFETKQLELWALNGVHLGLIGIKERIESMGGTFQINSVIGKGTVLNAAIPIE
ncbi:hypothetical protein LPY66_16190 [Dehalobacter sp. DCM]|uniref:ATP-binding protein n=1 Tax=Dehalobacter sp. DCM TaxID=2907827 RepID=UPI003081CA2F|nr:hypothetical protein LPY66_16190 [Dehalobacter sp. DCM]